jgi:hypothetical protein
MTAYTCDAALAVSAAPTFPMTFPFTFGPSASATRGAVADVSTGITATTTNVLNMSGRFDPALAITITPAAHAVLGIMASANLTITETTVVDFTGGRAAIQINAALAVIAGRSAGVTFSGTLSAALHETATALGAVRRAVFASATQNLTLTSAAVLNLHGHFAAAELITITEHGAARLAGAMNASETIIPTTGALIGQHQHCDAGLVIATYGVFPYIFPFTFEQAADTMSRGQSLSASETITAASDGTLVRGRYAGAALSLTANIIASALSGGDHPGDAALAATLTPAAGMTRNRFVSTVLETITVTPGAGLRLDAHTSATLHVGLTAAAHANTAALMHAPRVITVGIESLINMGGSLNSTTLVELAQSAAFTRGQSADASLQETLTWDVLSNLEYFIDAPLRVHMVFSATTPSPMNFFPFYMR